MKVWVKNTQSIAQRHVVHSSWLGTVKNYIFSVYLPPYTMYKILSLTDNKLYDQKDIPNLKGHTLKVVLVA